MGPCSRTADTPRRRRRSSRTRARGQQQRRPAAADDDDAERDRQDESEAVACRREVGSQGPGERLDMLAALYKGCMVVSKTVAFDAGMCV